MDYEIFKKLIIDKLRDDMPSAKSISIEQLEKNNGITHDGLLIREGDINISPVIHLDYYYDMYCGGVPFQETYARLLDKYMCNRASKSIDMDFFLDYERVEPSLSVKLINYRENSQLLENIPHRRFLDLAIVYYSYFPMSGEHTSATILINNDHLENWGISEDDLYEDAVHNAKNILPAKLESMSEILGRMINTEKTEKGLSGDDIIPADAPGEPPSESACKDAGMHPDICGSLNSPEASESFEPSGSSAPFEIRGSSDNPYTDPWPMIILSNSSNLYGASCILYEGLLHECAENLRKDFYILPSSVHEVILIPADSCKEIESLSAIVREVNDTQLSHEEILSDHAYYYSRRSDTITM